MAPINPSRAETLKTPRLTLRSPERFFFIYLLTNTLRRVIFTPVSFDNGAPSAKPNKETEQKMKKLTLTQELRIAEARVRNLRDAATELYMYLSSDKFRGEGNDFVNCEDVRARIRETFSRDTDLELGYDINPPSGN